MELISIGLMSGSSMDGIDGALIKTNGKESSEYIQGLSLDYAPQFKVLLRSVEAFAQQVEGLLSSSKALYEDFLPNYLTNNKSEYHLEVLKKYLKISLEENITIDSIIKKLTLLHADLVKDLIKGAKLKAQNVDVIGFHGQTIYHNPSKTITVQIGDGQLLANDTGIFVVNDFRSNDVKNGGQGAPFAPLYHQVLASKRGEDSLGFINCGGISNITIIDSKEISNLMGYDTGPGNVLIDRFIREKTSNKEFMDKDGQYGRQGTVNQDMLLVLKQKSIRGQDKENFFEKLPPKSLDSRNFSIPEELNHLKFVDACATIEAFTPFCIVESLKLIKMKMPKVWVLAGGGWKNPIIYKYLVEYLTKAIEEDIKIFLAEEVGWSGQFMEAEIFAYLAVRSLNKLPISVPGVTKVNNPTFGGKGYLPSNSSVTKLVTLLLEINPNLLTGYKSLY